MIVYLWLEALSILFCVNGTYGEKVHIDKYSVIFLGLDSSFLVMMNYFHFSGQFSLIVYVFIIGYVLLEFKRTLKENLINLTLVMIVMSCAQLIVITIYSFLDDYISINYFAGIVLMNIVVLLCMGSLYHFRILAKISNYFQQKDFVAIVILIIELVSVGIASMQVKQIKGIDSTQYTMLLILLVLVFILCVNLLLYKIRYQEQKSELEIYQTYSSVFKELITDMRVRQHDFDNHINAICNLHYVCTDYNTLVEKQSGYAKDIISDNLFARLLSAGNPVLSGFLYGRFQTIHNQGIEIKYLVKVPEWKYRIPVHKVVELMGNLLNNATDALLEQPDECEKLLYVECIGDDNGLQIVIRNSGEKLSYEVLNHMFEKGYSSKGENRGLGLYHVKQICTKYKIQIICGNKLIQNQNWIEFVLKFQ